MLIDVVISTKDNHSRKNFSLEYVIRSLLHQSLPDFNIIVADNGSEDETSEALRRRFGQKVGLVDTSEYTGNLSASRNVAANCGKAKHILFMDDDMVLRDAETLARTIEVAEEVDFVCGARRLWAPLTWPDLVRSDDPIRKFLSTLCHIVYEPNSVNRINGKNILDHRSYLANFGMISRDVFNRIGGFDEAYVGWGYQDTDLMYRLCTEEFDYELLANRNIEVFHLAHKVNKSMHYETNRQRFMKKQAADGRLFHTNHFFEIYENDGFSLFSDFPVESMD